MAKLIKVMSSNGNPVNFVATKRWRYRVTGQSYFTGHYAFADDSAVSDVKVDAEISADDIVEEPLDDDGNSSQRATAAEE